ncbi:MAG: prephenate dehydratase [Veillonellales bacterium]
MKLGYLGPSGSYSYEAACRYAVKSGEEAECIPFSGFAAIINGVEQGSLDSGILPVENSTYGAVANAMDMLLSLCKTAVCGEIILDIEHCLLSSNPNINEIQYVYSHEQALEQCHNFFFERYPHIKQIFCSSTSQACQLAKKNGAAYGAVAGKTAAELYNLLVAEQNIQDNAFNQTRFLIIGGNRFAPTGWDKTSIAIAFPGDCPGNLYKILKSFADRNINLTRIESRPAKNTMGKYVFYIDFLGHIQADANVSLLEEIEKQVEWLKILGSYPMDTRE